MPIVFREAGFRFHFYSSEGNPREPVHIHVARAGGDVKLWLYPEVQIAYNRRLGPSELRAVREIVIRRRQEIEDAWNSFFSRSDQGGV